MFPLSGCLTCNSNIQTFSSFSKLLSTNIMLFPFFIVAITAPVILVRATVYPDTITYPGVDISIYPNSVSCIGGCYRCTNIPTLTCCSNMPRDIYSARFNHMRTSGVPNYVRPPLAKPTFLKLTWHSGSCVARGHNHRLRNVLQLGYRRECLRQPWHVSCRERCVLAEGTGCCFETSGFHHQQVQRYM